VTAVSGFPAGAGEANPFAQIAVARVLESEQGDPVTVDTTATATATGILDDYLVGSGGMVLAVVGDYGTGKTHLVMRLLRHVRDRAGDRVRCVYTEAPSEGFLGTYHRFIGKLDEAEILDRVKRYYADVVADSLGGSDLTQRIVERLREGTADPTLVVERFALMESTLLRGLQDRLRGVTENAAFATVLMLLLRPGFEPSVWAWLRGGEPDPILNERGILSRIDNDAAALEAMGVVALLHHTRDRRFMFVIDELDKVLSAATNPDAVVLTAFRQLLRVFDAAGAMLVLSGLPDFLEVVPTDTRERIGARIEMPPLSAEQTRQFIMLSQERTFGVHTLNPFTPDIVDYLVRLARGVVRQVIRLCYGTFRLAAEEQSVVTVPIVEKVARDQLYLHTTHHEVRESVLAVLDRNGWQYRTDHRLTGDPLTQVDFWITPDGTEPGYGIILTGSVLNDGDVADLMTRATAIADARGSEHGRGALLLVNGYLTAEIGRKLGEVFGTPLVYEPRSFDSALTMAMTAMTSRLQAAAGDDTLAVMSERVERLQRQQATTHAYLEDVSAHLDEFTSSTGRTLAAIAGLLTVAPPALGEAALVESDESAVLPSDVADLFADALAALAELDRFDHLLRDAFGVDDRTHRSLIRSRLSGPDTTQAAGVAVLLRKAIKAFRAGVTAWYVDRADRPETAQRLSQEDRDELDTLCSTYDAISEYLPPFHVTKLGELTATVNEDRDPVARTARRRQQTRTRDVLDSLSMRVRQAVLVSAGQPDWAG
jgi:Cdc6-like AAA superfamily ATPase